MYNISFLALFDYVTMLIQFHTFISLKVIFMGIHKSQETYPQYEQHGVCAR